MPQQHSRMSSPECHDREGDGIFRLKRARGRKGMEGQGLDGSRDTLRVEQLAKMLGHAWCVEDTRRRCPEAFSHTVL
jgi:hypothetical protein